MQLSIATSSTPLVARQGAVPWRAMRRLVSFFASGNTVRLSERFAVSSLVVLCPLSCFCFGVLFSRPVLDVVDGDGASLYERNGQQEHCMKHHGRSIGTAPNHSTSSVALRTMRAHAHTKTNVNIEPPSSPPEHSNIWNWGLWPCNVYGLCVWGCEGSWEGRRTGDCWCGSGPRRRPRPRPRPSRCRCRCCWLKLWLKVQGLFMVCSFFVCSFRSDGSDMGWSGVDVKRGVLGDHRVHHQRILHRQMTPHQ